MNIFEELEVSITPQETYVNELPKGIFEYALKEFEDKLSYLYYGSLIVLPLTPNGEIERINLYGEPRWINEYGAYEYNFNFNGETYLAILVNGD